MRALPCHSCVLLLLLTACGEDGPSFTDAPPAIDAPNIDAPEVDGPPGPVTSFAATNTATGLSLSWVNPTDADLAGVLIVAGNGVDVSFAPTDGTTYTVGNAVGTDQIVLVYSLTTSLADAPFIPGADTRFAAWAYDAAGQYSPIALTAGRSNVLGTQQGQIQLFQNGTVVVTQQPRHLRLSGSVIYDDVTDTMQATLRAQNQTQRIVFNLKGLVDTTSQGAITNQTFPAVGGLPMTYFGPHGLLPGASEIDFISLTGIDGTVDPVVLTVHFVDAPSLVVQGSNQQPSGGGNERGFAVVDSSGSGRRATISLPAQPCSRAEGRGLAVTADGRWAFSGAKSIPRINRLDLPTLTVTQSPDLDYEFAVASVGGVALSPDGRRLYVTLQDGVHYRGGGGSGGSCGGGGKLRGSGSRGGAAQSAGGGSVGNGFAMPPAGGPIFGAPPSRLYLVELDVVSMAELRRMPLVSTPNRSKVAIAGNRAVVLNNDGGDGAAIHIVDLTTWTEVDADPVQPDVQPLFLAQQPYEVIAVSPGHDHFAVATSSATKAGSYDVHDYELATLTATTVTSTITEFQRLVGLAYGSDGRLLVLSGTATKGPSGTELERIEGGAPVSVFSSRADDQAQGLILGPDRLYLADRWPQIRVFDTTAGFTQLDTDGDNENGVTPMAIDDPIRPHGVAGITPF